jgi:hypothetical protein
LFSPAPDRSKDDPRKMKITLPVSQDLFLTIGDGRDDRVVYPTSRLKKGFGLSYRGLDLAEEAVGFGLPVLKQGLQTYFPGEVDLNFLHGDRAQGVTAVFTINLVEKVARPGRASVDSRLFYAVKNSLAAFIRSVPLARDSLTALSSHLRRLFGWETTYEKDGFSARVEMSYEIDEKSGVLAIEANLIGLPQDGITEVIVMNEQGAHYFDQYHDSAGVSLSGKEIGCWDEVVAGEAGFASSSHRVAFTLPRVPGARLFRGRELIGSRLAWAGFGYSFPPTISRFNYSVKIEELP